MFLLKMRSRMIAANKRVLAVTKQKKKLLSRRWANHRPFVFLGDVDYASDTSCN